MMLIQCEENFSDDFHTIFLLKFCHVKVLKVFTFLKIVKGTVVVLTFDDVFAVGRQLLFGHESNVPELGDFENLVVVLAPVSQGIFVIFLTLFVPSLFVIIFEEFVFSVLNFEMSLFKIKVLLVGLFLLMKFIFNTSY